MCASVARPPESRPPVPLLVNGDRLSQPEFHRRYEAYPGDEKFELIGGVVYVASPVSSDHGEYNEELGFLCGLYRRATPGTQLLYNATAVLGKKSEPQPDCSLRILQEFGGQSVVNERKIVVGSPELGAEIAYSSRAIDLHHKKADYRLAGMREYLVVALEEPKLYWFNFADGGEILADELGVFRSCAFPGLWIDGPALLALDSARLRAVVEQGIASDDHAAFVQRLQEARAAKK